jgi:hypothetical protein
MNPLERAERRVALLQKVPPGRWVALAADELSIVAIARSYLEVVAQAEAQGVPDAVVLRRPLEPFQ